MKKLLITVLAALLSTSIFSQWGWNINFEDWDIIEERIFIDTISNQNNIWQIGQPSKIIFNEAYSIPNSIVTDTLNYYPINDTSSFIITHVRPGDQGGNETLQLNFWFKSNSDTLTDYGTVEASIDNGQSWINLLTDDVTYNFQWLSTKPVLTGNTDDWQQFALEMNMLTYELGYSDTILYKFTFISDDINNDKEGWMIDNLWFADEWESIETIRPHFNSSVIPNPVNKYGILRFENDQQIKNKIEILNLNGQVIEAIETNSNKIEIHILDLIQGVYIYRITNERGSSFGKFIIKSP